MRTSRQWLKPLQNAMILGFWDYTLFSMRKFIDEWFYNDLLSSIPNIAQNGVAEFIERFDRIRNLEEIKFCPSICYSPQNEFMDRFIVIPKLNNMKNFMTKSASQNGWTSMTGDAGQFLPRYISSFPEAFNPIKFKYILHKLPVSTPAVMALSQIFPKMTNTREVFIEFYR